MAGFESDKKKQRDYDKSANEEALSSLVSALHEQFVFFPLATEEQWNEDIAETERFTLSYFWLQERNTNRSSIQIPR